MSVASEITRLQNAKASLKTAIEGKGVTVPGSTKLDGYADLVESISGGGSDDDNWYFISADADIQNVDDYYVKQIYLGKRNNNQWYFRAYVIGNSAQGLKCWFRYKGEDYFVDSFSDGKHTLSKQGAPVSCTISDFLSLAIYNNNGVYEAEYYED